MVTTGTIWLGLVGLTLLYLACRDWNRRADACLEKYAETAYQAVEQQKRRGTPLTPEEKAEAFLNRLRGAVGWHRLLGRRRRALLIAECLHNRHNGGHQTELPDSFRAAP